ncbi:hypothetical protein CMV_025115 [Castanea mollissima]|uniref:C-JID domain-containing protein n=1 Tax=Castanea mollissima TaxID=60419 RepID=A0A8J4QMJ4_9ROSI|nr:hypothetical protein CMV_025115 [Castanea mollissima]
MVSFSAQKANGKVREEQIKEWRSALKEVSKIRGRHLVDSPESVDIEEITKSIFDELNRELSDDSEHLDVFHVLKENTGTEVVEGIVLDFQGIEVIEDMVLNSPPRKENLNDKAFSNMKSLRLLKISNVHLPTGLCFLSNKLRMMEWHDYPLKFMPKNFQPDNLVELIMPRSHIKQLPEGLTNLAKLRLLDLTDSKVLVKTPNFIGCPNLERLIFQGCTDYDHDPLFERYLMGLFNQNMYFLDLLHSTETPEWFSHQSPGTSSTIPLPSNLRGDGNWIGIALFTSVVILENLNNVSSGQDDELSIDFICRSDIIEGPCITCPLFFNVSKNLPEPFRHASSFGCKIVIPAGKLRDHLEDCSCIRAFIRTKCTYIKIETCSARVLYKQDLGKFLQASGKMKQRSQFQMDKVESSQSNDRLKGKLLSLLLRVYQGDLARNHKYDYVFPHKKVSNWFSNRNFCYDIRIKLPTNLQNDGTWMGIAVCAYYTVHKQPGISGDNKDLASFLNFYNHLDSDRVCLSRHRVFQESKDIFVESPYRILVFYIPQVLLRLGECRHIGASFEHDKPDVRIEECGLRLVYEQDVENFVQTLAQCMLESPDAYHECFYQNLLHQVEEREASKDFGFSSSLQRMPQPMPVLQPRNENMAEGCTFSATSPSSFTGFLATARKEQYASIMSSESLIKARLEKTFDEGEIFNCCFAEREIPPWFCYEDDEKSVEIPLSPEYVNDPDWMGFALCGLLSFNMNPTAVRQSLSSKKIGMHQCRSIGMLQFRCLLRTSSSNQRLVCHGILTMDNELVTLNQRSFIWVMFIPRNTHAHLWSQSAWAEFQLQSEMPHLFAHSFGINVVYRKNMEELTQILVQCSTPFDSFLDSLGPEEFCYIWDNYPEDFIGRKNSYEYLHPQRLFISQEENSVTAQYSYEEDSYPHNRFRYFHPSTLYNSCFPTRRTPRWFNHYCRLGHSVTIEIPPNLYEDNNWLGLSLYASILIPRGQENAVPTNSSHFLYCQFQTSKASLDNQILVCRTTNEEDDWLRQFSGLIWISYIPGEALKDMLHQCGHIKASFVSDWPSVMVQKCGLRLLYQHDLSQFEQQLKHCNASISANRDCKCECSHSGGIPMKLRLHIHNEIVSPPLNNYVRNCEYSFCFPPVEILHCFYYQSNEPSVKIDISNYFFNDNKWMGLVLCAYFSSDKHQTAIIENPNSSISHHLICVLETDGAAPEPEIHVHRTIQKEFTWLDIEGGFLWLCYIPCCPFLDEFSCIKASIISDWPGIIVQKWGLSFYHMREEWFLQIICDLIMEEPHGFRVLNDQLIARYKVKISRAKNQLSQSHLPGFDGSCDYNSCHPPIEIPHWFRIQSDKSHVTFRLTRKLHNESTWLGVALCAVFFVTKDVASLIDIMDSISSYKLICHLEASNGPNDLSVKPRHIYWPTKEDLKISLLGGLTWLTYIPRGSFPDWLYDCVYIKVSFETNCSYLKVQNCGLRLLYQDSVEEFKNCVKNCMKSESDFLGIHDQKKTENINKKTRSWIQNELGKNDPLGFDRCIYNNLRLPPSEILDWFSKLSNEPWVAIDLPPNLYSDSSWMGLVLCAYFVIDVNRIVHFDILDSDTPYELICHLETNVGHVRPLHGYSLAEENLIPNDFLQQGGCILLSYRGRNCLNQANCVKASFTTDCPGLKVEKCGLRLLYHYELEEFEQTILSHSMNSSSSDDWDLIHQLPTEDGNRDTQEHDYGEGTSSSSKESNFGSLRSPIDPEDKGKRVLEEYSVSWTHD